MTSAGLGADSCDLQPGRLWSMADVINSNVTGLCALCAQLMLEQLSRQGLTPLTQQDIKDAHGWLKVAANIANDFEIQGVHDRIDVIKRRMRFGINQEDLATEYRVLLETVEFGMKNHLVYRYPTDRAKTLYAWTEDWRPTLISFPSAQDDIKASVDLWALQHSTAAVFHLMRVLEYGLRALAADLGLTFDIQQWQNILDQIESQIQLQAKTLPRGAARNERLRFLSAAAKEFRFFKDGWRNYVSHNREAYDDHQARSVMDHVRSVMNGLSSQLAQELDL